MLGPTAHTDTFARDNLPPEELWPDFVMNGFDYPERLNAGVELTDAMVAKGFGDHTALIGNGRQRTYKELTDWTKRLAHALVDDLGIAPGNRVLIRSANNPAMVACWLAATKVGAVGDQHDADAALGGVDQICGVGRDLPCVMRYAADGGDGGLCGGVRGAAGDRV